MLHPILRLASVSSILLALAVVLVCVVPYDDSQLNSFMTAPENCTGPCLLGIRPGKMTVGEAIQLLQTHPWVESTRLTASGNGYGQIRWEWNGKQPDSIDDSYPGRITFYWDDEESSQDSPMDSKIETISIQTNIRMYSLQDWYGVPNSGTAGFRLDSTLGYSAGYHDPGTTISLLATMFCPVNLLTYWNSRTLIRVSIGWGTSTYVSPVDMEKMC